MSILFKFSSFSFLFQFRLRMDRTFNMWTQNCIQQRQDRSPRKCKALISSNFNEQPNLHYISQLHWFLFLQVLSSVRSRRLRGWSTILRNVIEQFHGIVIIFEWKFSWQFLHCACGRYHPWSQPVSRVTSNNFIGELKPQLIFFISTCIVYLLEENSLNLLRNSEIIFSTSNTWSWWKNSSG